jgi:uncharacterized membrane protein
MSKKQPFIPRDKPKFWVLGVLSALCGLGLGLLALGAAWYGIDMLKEALIVLFAACWVTFILSWLGFVFGLLSGRYQNITEKSWREQSW